MDRVIKELGFELLQRFARSASQKESEMIEEKAAHLVTSNLELPSDSSVTKSDSQSLLRDVSSIGDHRASTLK